MSYASFFKLLFNILSDEGTWQIEVENKWCIAENGNHWVTSISSALECQYLCMKFPSCIGFSYSYSSGMINTCFICKDDALSTNSYGFAFYRKGKMMLIIIT